MSNLYIGIMSGTSLDGVDIALCEIKSDAIALLAFDSFAFDASIKVDILKATTQKIEIREVGLLDERLGQMYAKYSNLFLEKNHLNRKDINAIGLHGQTLWHEPNEHYPFSMQLGNPNRVAYETNIAVVCDIRRKDMTSMGQGAPFAPLFHKCLFRDMHQKTAVINLGGIANITILDDDLIGYDTGCGNILLDSWCEKHFGLAYDKDGLLAREGSVDEVLLKKLLSDAYFLLSYPKSTGREHFNIAWLESKIEGKIGPKDVLRTLVELTAITIANEAKKFHLEQLILCGGGAKNIFLVQRIEAHFQKTVKSSEAIGVNPHTIEAQMMAYFAYLRINHKKALLKSVTGAKQNLILGGLYEPD